MAAGSVENIKLWCFLTCQQRMVFFKSHILFLSCWGTGKTLLMISKAIELADLGEKVLFLVFISGNENLSEKTLLIYDLEMKFKTHDKIHLKPVYFWNGKKNGLKELAMNYKHIMIDEMFCNFGWFHLHLLYFPFVYQFHPRMTIRKSFTHCCKGK